MSGWKDRQTNGWIDGRMDGQTDGHTEGLQNRPRRLTGQNVRTQKINKFLYLEAPCGCP
jgi:hypothetical protein